MRPRTTSAFTLVEILVAVGIILVLCAIIIPIVGKARGRAHDATCISQLAQIGKATGIYMEDYSDRPLALHSLHPQYVPDRRLFVCPQDAWVDHGGWAWSAWGKYSTPGARWPFPVSYGYFFAPTPQDGLWEKVQAAPGRPGYLVCVLHGEPTGGLQPGDAPFFQGKVLRLCFDGSVITRIVKSKHAFNAWKLRTDQDKEPGAP
jgi:type II secretory pathway pseudopilin PulG